MPISYLGINDWNKLDPEVKCATTVNDLKNKFKNKLLGKRITKIQSVFENKISCSLCINLVLVI